jgi:hypothetical protein
MTLDLVRPHSMSSVPAGLLGRTEPRLWTPPLRELTPDTSVGFDQIDFARDVLNRPADPWQEWLWIHAGELLPDGRPRFRIVLVLVARQNGKTETPVILSAFWQFVDEVPMILGTSTKTEYAKESWLKAVKLVESAPALESLRIKRWTRMGAGDQESFTIAGSRYKIAASNAEGGRSMTVHRLICDELRQHHDYSAWDAAEPACSPMGAQIWALSNAGDDRSVVLNDLREAALSYIEHGQGDYRLGLFEWSAPDDADPTDLEALAQANPNLNRPGHGIDAEVLLLKAQRAVAKGGEQLAGFKTENMCIRVPMLDPAIDPDAWAACMVVGDLRAMKSRSALCLDISPDQQHATLCAAAVMPDDRVRVEVAGVWDGPDATKNLRAELPALLERSKPQVLGWMPNGPAASLAARLADRKGVRGWPPKGVTVAEIRAEVAAVCMGFAEQVYSQQILQADDALLNDHVTSASKLKNGDVWRFSRRGGGHCDAAYAAAGAVHLARTLPTPIGKPRLVLPD